MILRSLHARDFMRFRQVAVTDLPARGLVGVVGENESGKSTLGECVSFALFGETVKSRLTDLSQVVSWDAERASVELEIEVQGGRRYRIERSVDRRGRQEARLRQVPGGEPVEGPEAVEDAIRRLCRLDFDLFRAGFYLAQQELGQLRREDPKAGQHTLERVVGIHRLEVAAGATRHELTGLERRHEELSRRLAVAEGVLAADPLPKDAGRDLDAEATRWRSARESAAARLPDAEAQTSRAREAVAARSRTGKSFNALHRAHLAAALRREMRGTGRELARIWRGIQAEVDAASENLAYARRHSEETCRRIDRVIDYRTRMAQLEARLELYRNEVKRNLEAPTVTDEDLASLESLALPATPAAGARLTEARVRRIREQRNRAAVRAGLVFVLAILFGLVGLPAFARLVDTGAVPKPLPVPAKLAASEALGGLSQLAAALESGCRAVGLEPTSRVWATMAVSGLLGLGCGIVLCILFVMRWLSRGDELQLATEAHRRIEGEVEALRAELSCLDELSLQKPVEFAERVKTLHNPVIRDRFEAIRDAHNDFVSDALQGDELVQSERATEGRAREKVARIEERTTRLQRIQEALPLPGSCPELPAGGAAAAVPEDVTAFRRKAEELRSRFDRARRTLDDLSRAAGAGDAFSDAARIADELRGDLAAVEAALATDVPSGAAAARAAFAADLERMSREAHRLPASELEVRLDAIGQELGRALPSVDELLRLQDEAEQAERSCRGALAEAEGKLQALAARLQELEARRALHARRTAELEGLRAERAPLVHDVQLHRLAAELLEETAADLRRRVGPMLARFAAKVLPRLTAGRYRKVRVSPDLDLRVYSPDKNDFVPLVDLSIGAADQLLLALRLGLGIALVRARGLAGEAHFLFLDEPVASFDEARARGFLDLLAERGELFSQVFLVTHQASSSLEGVFSRTIVTQIARRTLGVEGDEDEEAVVSDVGIAGGAESGDTAGGEAGAREEGDPEADRSRGDVEAFSDLLDLAP